MAKSAEPKREITPVEERTERLGPKNKHSNDTCKKAWASYQAFYKERNDFIQAWNKVARHHGFKNWQAAKQACYRWRKKQNKKYN